MQQKQFPFGQPLLKVQQKDTSPNKQVFVLGVYASAVHAKWLNPDGSVKVQALAVASEPEIFWRGHDAHEIISEINVPKEVGSLVPANENLNGPSGKALDDLFLNPLGFSRYNAWLCDLLPESRVNANQKKAVDSYNNLVKISGLNLPVATIPDFDENEIKENAVQRHLEILNELEKSGANTIILLGDLPIQWFLHFFDKRTKLSQFGNLQETYGQRHEVMINTKTYSVIPLCHPRNAARLGAHSSNWAEWHKAWVKAKYNVDTI
jgi:uracil-DNA glycosylase